MIVQEIKEVRKVICAYRRRRLLQREDQRDISGKKAKDIDIVWGRLWAPLAV